MDTGVKLPGIPESFERQAPLNLQIVDRDGSTIAASDACLRAFGVQRDELVGPGKHNLFQDRIQRECGIVAAIEKAFTGERVILPLVELPAEPDGGGESMLISVEAFPLRDGDAIPHVGILYRDVRDKLILQKNLLAKNAELEQFVYTVSHDLKSPLAVITGCLEIIRDIDTVDDDVKHHLDMIGRSANTIRRFVGSLLSLSRAGRAMDNEQPDPPVELAMLVKGIFVDLETAYPDLPFTWEIGALPTIQIPYTDCSHLFQNLLGNAVKYHHPERPLHIAVSCETSARAHRISVRDTGRGVPAAERERIFEVFTRGSNTALDGERLEGTGVGLAIVRKIVEKAGGKVWVESRAGEGSTFIFSLPRERK